MKTRLFRLSLLFLIITGGFTFSFAEFGPIWHCAGSDTMEKFGATFTSIGDQNQDGFDDILIGNQFGVHLYFGGNPMDTIPDMIFTETCEYCYGGLPLECRDLNGDSHPDIAISADFTWLSLINPETYVYFGGPLLDNQADLILRPDSLDSSNSEFGTYSQLLQSENQQQPGRRIEQQSQSSYAKIFRFPYCRYSEISSDPLLRKTRITKH